VLCSMSRGQGLRMEAHTEVDAPQAR